MFRVYNTFEISSMLLEMVSNYNKYHEYYFSSHRNLWFNAPVVQYCIFRKNMFKRNKLKIYSKYIKNCAKFEHALKIKCKVSRKKLKAKKNLCRVPNLALDKDYLCRVTLLALGKGWRYVPPSTFAECLALPRVRHSAKTIFAEGRPLPSVWHSTKRLFAECLPLPSARLLALGKAFDTRQSSDFL